VVRRIGARPFGFGGELDLQAGRGDFTQELVAAGPQV
jgi:hypothetical protein